ncbi:Uncharacterized protein Fot_24505 [Forsythia ovata]|uniref:Uncharacterized protein n=1 Tax=Forsythia ovata TaxID=205694 RepID=A0ABD1U6E6_9LAMI
MGSEATYTDSTNLKLRELLKEAQHDYSPESTKIINDFVTADLGPGFVRDIGADKVEFKFKKPKSIEIGGTNSKIWDHGLYFQPDGESNISNKVLPYVSDPFHVILDVSKELLRLLCECIASMLLCYSWCLLVDHV